MEASAYFLISFLIGAVPFSSLLVYIFARKNIRDYGDGNPGASNALRAGGKVIGMTALILDSFKGVIPVAIWAGGLTVWQEILIAIAPVIGHAFSPFLKFKGGKGIATSFGIWTGLGLWGAPISMGAGAIASKYLLKDKSDEVKVLAVFLCLGVFLLVSAGRLNLWLLYTANCAIVAVKQAQYYSKGSGNAR